MEQQFHPRVLQTRGDVGWGRGYTLGTGVQTNVQFLLFNGFEYFLKSLLKVKRDFLSTGFQYIDRVCLSLTRSSLSQSDELFLACVHKFMCVHTFL